MLCTLKMLGIYSPKLNEIAISCGPRVEMGTMVKYTEIYELINDVIKEITDIEHDFDLQTSRGAVPESLEELSSILKPQEACYFIYGREGDGSHAVVLRKGVDGQLELIDPQRGQADIGTKFGLPSSLIEKYGIEVKPNYYRVRGNAGIQEVLVKQSVLFKYWESEKEVIDKYSDFMLGALYIDNVNGLKMLIDRPPERMVEDTPAQQEDIQMKETEFESSQIGGVEGDKTPPRSTPGSIDGDATQSLDSGSQTGVSVSPAPTESGSASDSDSGLSDFSRLTLFENSLLDKIADLFLERNGTMKFISFQLDNYVQPLKGGAKIDTKQEKTGQSKKSFQPKYRRLTDREFLVTKYNKYQRNYANVVQPLFQEAKIGDFRFDQIHGIQTILASKGKPAFLGFERSSYMGRGGWESPGATKQCENVNKITGRGSPSGDHCWLCGNKFNLFTPAPKTETYGPDATMQICNSEENEFQCEHVLPAPMMFFLGYMQSYAKTRFTPEEIEMIRRLYDGSCALCNGVKDNGLYIQTSANPSGQMVFITNPINILKDIIFFFTTVKSSYHGCNTEDPAVTFNVPEKLDNGNTTIKKASIGSAITITGSDGQLKNRYHNLTRALLETLDIPDVNLEDPNIKHLQGDINNISVHIGNVIKDPADVVLNSSVRSYILNPPERDKEDIARLPTIPSTTRTAGLEALTAMTAANFVLKVDRNKAARWILSRFVYISNRMSEICGVLNLPENLEKWDMRVKSLRSQPVLTMKNLEDLRLSGPFLRKTITGGGIRVTIRRRRLHPQKKKVIEVNI